ncbi:MAG: hypothetical protein CMH59_20435, partial [Myxococcales bacterium]|nr:hypothetical protein [Myxococcales bacterium]
MSRDGDEPERAPASRTPEDEAPGPGTRPRSRQVARGAAGGNDDFLYHLYRGSSMLLQDQVVEAKEELERALALQPQDAKSQDLLAGVYFRLGVYPRAIEIWRRLVDAYPKEPTLRVNLALALFKTGQADDALEHVHEALRIQPDHERAWGYLGLIHWRLGQLEAARDAFLRGGQASMARRMEEALGRDAPMPDPGPSGEELEASDRAAMRSAAEEALERLDSESPRLALEGQAGRAEGRPSGVWSPIEPGTEVVPPRPAETRPRLLGEPPTLADRVRRWTVALSPDTPLAVTASGALLVQAEHDVF